MAVTLADNEFNMVWFSQEFRKLTSRFEGFDVDKWLGHHWAEFSLSDEFLAATSRRSVMRAGLDLLPPLMHGTPGGRERLREILTAILGADAAGVVDQVPDTAPPIWGLSFKWSPAEGMAPVATSLLGIRIHDDNGDYVGNAGIYIGALPYTVASMLARGDPAILERSARLIKPGRRQAVVLFADLQASSLLSRNLPSAVFFKVVQSVITEVDAAIATHEGVVGRHAGDGLSAFFVVEQVGSASAACRAAVEAAKDIKTRVGDAGARLETDTAGAVRASDCVVNVGVHWGGTLYMGQLLTEGRLEVTALGDAVNECARIQESARDGQALASKALIENLSSDDAAALGLDPDTLVYRTIADIPSASEKAKRDAGVIPVVAIGVN
ncbi:MAG: adenylate/guanylate cyclase domain-containing protein [Candidatus Dormiibacterota bacterium]